MGASKIIGLNNNIYIKISMGNSLHIFEVHLVETYFKLSNLPNL
jgi:hypothetical protein